MSKVSKTFSVRANQEAIDKFNKLLKGTNLTRLELLTNLIDNYSRDIDLSTNVNNVDTINNTNGLQLEVEELKEKTTELEDTLKNLIKTLKDNGLDI